MAVKNYYYDENNSSSSTFMNTIHASSMALQEHYANVFFDGDQSRVVYASNQYAFRKRLKGASKDFSTADFPFVNFAITNIDSTTNNFMWNHIANMNGIYIDDLQRKLRLAPIKVEYEATFWCKQEFDRQAAYHRWISDDSNETRLIPSVQTFDGYALPISMELNYSYSANSFEEDTWLEQNKIRNFGLGTELDFQMLFDDDGGAISIIEEAVLNFISSNNLDHDDPLESDPQVLITKYFSE